MQELEKILEEIKAASRKMVTTDMTHKYYKAVGTRKIEEIIRKHMNDGWIPVEERLPINDEGAVEVTVKRGYRTVGYYDQYREEWWTLDEDSILDVIAWKEPSEPYRPERSEK